MVESGKCASGQRDEPDSILKEQGSWKRMELPRGRFRALKKNTSLHILLHELFVTAFTGCCGINLGSNITLLLFKQGRIILAEYDGISGDVALDRICSHIDNQVEVILDEFDDGQIRLALEFNPSWKVSMEQGLSCFCYHEYHPLPIAEPVVVTVSRKTNMPGINTETGENSDVSVSIEQVQEKINRLVSIIDFESHCIPEFSEEPPLGSGPHDEPGWKKALRFPVGPMTTPPKDSLPDEPKTSSMVSLLAKSQSRLQGWKCNLLSADSRLFDNKPVKKKFLHIKYPEPAEQWKTMSVNLGPNNSV